MDEPLTETQTLYCWAIVLPTARFRDGYPTFMGSAWMAHYSDNLWPLNTLAWFRSRSQARDFCRLHCRVNFPNARVVKVKVTHTTEEVADFPRLWIDRSSRA